MKLSNIKISKKIIPFLMVVLFFSAVIGYSYINSDLNSTGTITAKKYSCDSITNLYDKLACMSTMDNVKSKYVSSNIGINYAAISSDTNGKGVYAFSKSLSDEYPVYFYRGAVQDNNVIFANICWKIVRTTDTGGVKLLYSGVPTENNQCTATSTDAELLRMPFNTRKIRSPAYLGYMYGTVYEHKLGGSVNYAKSATYENGTYTLKDTVDTLDSTHHYSCGESSTSCSTLRYNYYKGSTDEETHYIELTDGILIEQALTDMNKNEVESDLKKYIEDTWYSNNMTGYNEKIEDTIYCNDRNVSNIAGWDPNGGVVEGTDSENMIYGPTSRSLNGTPSLYCEREEDRFTVSETIGNGELDYPVGFLTGDEATLAGGVANAKTSNSTFYLMTKSNYWLMSPIKYNKDGAFEMAVTGGGHLISASYTNIDYGVRPVISLKYSSAIISSGNGLGTNPYIIN